MRRDKRHRPAKRHKRIKRPRPDPDASKPDDIVLEASPELTEAYKRAAEAFNEKFGRPPGPGDPLIWDPDAETPQPYDPDKFQRDMIATMKEAGSPPHLIYAFEKTGLMLFQDRWDEYPPDVRERYMAAIDEYWEQHPEEAEAYDREHAGDDDDDDKEFDDDLGVDVETFIGIDRDIMVDDEPAAEFFPESGEQLPPVLRELIEREAWFMVAPPSPEFPRWALYTLPDLRDDIGRMFAAMQGAEGEVEMAAEFGPPPDADDISALLRSVKLNGVHADQIICEDEDSLRETTDALTAYDILYLAMPPTGTAEFWSVFTQESRRDDVARATPGQYAAKEDDGEDNDNG